MAVQETSKVSTRRGSRKPWAPVVDFTYAHPLLAIFLAAFVTRVFIAAVLTNYFSGTLVLDDTTYHKMAMQMEAGSTASWDEFTNSLYWSTAAFMVPVSVLYEIFGPHAFVGQMFVAVMGTLAAVFVTRLSMEFLPTKWALVAGVLVAFLPSQAFWSSMLMKDASVWFVLSGMGVCLAIGSRAIGRHLAILGVTIAVLMTLLSYLRLHTLVVAAWALMIASFFGVREQRVPRIVGAIAIATMVPLLFGAIGPAGMTLVTNHGSLEDRRFYNALGANTAIVPIDGVGPQTDNIPARDLEADALKLESQASQLEAADPIGAEDLRAKAQGLRERATKVPPPSSEAPETPLDPNLQHLSRGLSVMLLEPFPIPFEGSISLRLARLESLLWYPLLLLAGFGLWKIKRYLRQMIFPVLVGGGIVVMYALSEGNIGTAHRHRGEFVWVVALLATIGFSNLLEGRRRILTEDA